MITNCLVNILARAFCTLIKNASKALMIDVKRDYLNSGRGVLIVQRLNVLVHSNLDRTPLVAIAANRHLEITQTFLDKGAAR